MTRLLTQALLPPPQGRAMAERLTGLPPAEAEALLRRHVLAPSLRFAFCRNGKTGTTTLLAWLFEVEFGAPLTATLARDATLNENSIAHYLVQADIFRPALQMPGGLGHLRAACRIATVRHPAARALSAFRYICKSGAQGSAQFLTDRLRLNAETGFDWATDPLTPRGFHRFLDYVEILHQTGDLGASATHWRAQAHNLRPDILPPTVLGRLENLDQMARDLTEALNLDRAPAFGHHNTQGRVEDDLLAGPSLRRRIAEVYRDDFETFGYDPAEPLTQGPP